MGLPVLMARNTEVLHDFPRGSLTLCLVTISQGKVSSGAAMLLWDVLIILHPTLEQMREIWIIGAASSAPAAAAPPAGLVSSQPSPCLDILAP